MSTRRTPAAVTQALIDAGRVTVDRLGRAAQLRTCPRCRNWVVVGLDHHRTAQRIICDPVAVDPYGEAAALLSGRTTVELWGTELQERDAFKIRGGQKRPVLAEHLCGMTTTPSPDIVAVFVPVANTDEREKPCPF